MRTRFASILAISVAVLVSGLVACGGDDTPLPDASFDAPRTDAAVTDASETDAAAIDAPGIDAPTDAAIDAGIDAPADAMPTSSESIGFARTAPDGAANLAILNVTITYIKPAIGADPAGFTVQAEQAGPALMVAVDPSTLTPTPTVGDVVSFTITNLVTVGGQRRATAVNSYTRASQGANVGALAQSVSAATNLVSAIDTYESEILDVTGTIASNFVAAGSGFESGQITTAGMTVADPTFVLRVPITLRNSLDLMMGCSFTIDNTPVQKFITGTPMTLAQLSAFVAPADITVTACPGPIVVAAVATNATTVNITFSRNILSSSVTANGSQFTFDNGLTASAASVNGRVVTVTTGVQVNTTMYLATVANTVTDLAGTATGTPNTAMFTAFMSPTHLVLNEIDCNQLGTTDTNSFIEIYNPTPSSQPLANLAIAFVNGNGNIEYRAQVSLAPAGSMLAPGAYIVVRNSTVVVPGGVATIDVAGDFMQNGPDAIALINTSTMTVVDALSYGTPGLIAVTIAGVTGTPSMVEGTALTATDPNDDLNSLERVINGLDSNNAVTDWAVRTLPSPGAAN